MGDIQTQKTFVDKVTDLKNPQKKEKRPIELYKDLVHHRFFEVISNAYPIFNSLIEEKRLQKLVTKFIQSGSITPYIWKMPNEFRRFVKKNPKLFWDMPYINDLLWFEWIELKLFMRDYSSFKSSKFKTSSSYKLSGGARIKKLSFKVYERDFETKGEYHILAYYDISKQEVIYRELSPFMCEFIKLLEKSSISQAIIVLSKKYELDQEELLGILYDPLEELCTLGVLLKKEK